MNVNMRFGLLVALAVAVLVPSLSEGRIVSKCELRQKLGQVFPPKNKDNNLARVICEVGRRTQFNTSKLTVIGTRPLTTVKPTTPPGPVQTTGVAPVTNATTAQPNQTIPGIIVATTIQPNRSSPGARRRRDSKHSDEDESNEDIGKKRSPLGLYGLFQLTDRKACNSGYRPSKNVCQTKCDAFLDDDITDDIACLVRSRAWEDLLSDSRCSRKELVNYFAECGN